MGEKELQFVFCFFLWRSFFLLLMPRASSEFQPSRPSILQCSSKRTTGQALGHLVEQREMDWIFALHCFSSLYIQDRGWGQTRLMFALRCVLMMQSCPGADRALPPLVSCSIPRTTQHGPSVFPGRPEGSHPPFINSVPSRLWITLSSFRVLWLSPKKTKKEMCHWRGDVARCCPSSTHCVAEMALQKLLNPSGCSCQGASHAERESSRNAKLTSHLSYLKKFLAH